MPNDRGPQHPQGFTNGDANEFTVVPHHSSSMPHSRLSQTFVQTNTLMIGSFSGGVVQSVETEFKYGGPSTWHP